MAAKNKILIVDDDAPIAALLKTHLEGMGYIVSVGYDGQMALQLAQTEKPQLMVLDINMPMTNGLKTLEFMRKIPVTRDIPVIFLTGAPSQTVFKAVEAYPRVAYIKKPFELAQLSALIRELIEKYPS